MIALLIELARKDGEFNGDDKRFVMAIARRLGIDEHQVGQMISGEASGDYRSPGHEHQRIVDFQTLIYFAFSDGDLDQKEVEFLKKSGMRMGLHPNTVSRVIDLTHRYYPDTVPLNPSYAFEHNLPSGPTKA